MSLSVKIIDNDTGEVLVDEPESIGVMGVVTTHGEQYVEGKTEHLGIKSFGYVRCNRVAIYHMLTGLQKVIVDTQTKYPGIEKIGERLKLMGEIDDFIERMKSIMGNNDDDGN